MDYDLLVRRGRVVDGSGLPSYVADVGVKDGKIAEVGKLSGTAAKTIDADGLAVAPGFIDTDMTAGVPAEVLQAVPARRAVHQVPLQGLDRRAIARGK